MKKITFKLGQRVPKTEENPHGFNLIYGAMGKGPGTAPKFRDDSFLDHKSVLVLPGDGTTYDEEMNGTCKVVEGMLLHSGVKRENLPAIYCLGYRSEECTNHRMEVITEQGEEKFGKSKKAPENPTPEENFHQTFFNEYLLPLIRDEKGNPRSIKEIQKNFQNLTIVSHCHGGVLAFQLEKMLSEKLKDFYPEQAQALIGNLRMMHFASRRPMKENFGVKHFHIIAQNDDKFADDELLEHDNLHMQIHRNKIKDPQMLLPISDKEEVLLLKKITLKGDEEEEKVHSGILSVFSELSEENSENNKPAIKMTQQLLRHFVESPEDSQSIESQVAQINPDFSEKNLRAGKEYLKNLAEQGKINRGLLSILSNPNIHLAQRKKEFKDTFYNKANNDLLMQRDDTEKFLYPQLLENYKKTGDSRSLIHFLKDVDLKTYKTLLQEGRLLAIQNRDWGLFHAYGINAMVKEGEFLEMLSKIAPEDLVKIIPDMRIKNAPPRGCKTQGHYPKVIQEVLKKKQKIKNSSNRLRVENFLVQLIQDCSEKDLLKILSVDEKKQIKPLMEKRRERAAKEVKLLRERDKKATTTRLKEILKFHQMTGDFFGMDVFLQYKEEVKQNPKLTYHDFLMTHKNKEK